MATMSEHDGLSAFDLRERLHAVTEILDALHLAKPGDLTPEEAAAAVESIPNHGRNPGSVDTDSFATRCAMAGAKVQREKGNARLLAIEQAARALSDSLDAHGLPEDTRLAVLALRVALARKA
jgi:hypothetical protein